ncbi:hypothetical protein FM21_06740 [Streptomyces mutabilis]|uniref:Uncharacterized protein n=1 Tax=Streptomyces mutabilis TaxID=67332 RepID=A0A086N3T8_9ACTN|nr:hypothetical protein FM21_06740 [Streptomyces mutabilis]
MSTSAASGGSRPVNAFTGVRSVIAQIMWFTPLGAMSRSIFSRHSSGVPATERRSAMSGAVSPMPRARSPAAIASMTGLNPAGSTPLRRRLFLGYSAPALPAVVQRADGRKFRVGGWAFLVQRSSLVLQGGLDGR